MPSRSWPTSKAPPNNRHIIYFATDHDESTAASRDGLVRPLSEGDSTLGVVAPARKRGFTQESLIGPTATRANLQTVLRGAGPGGKPALLFAATHGAEFRPFTARDLPGRQGALICQDWTGEGEVRPEHWFAADELPADLDVEGLIVVCFACYGLGCPQFDSYTPAEGRKRQVAPRALVAALPQRLLARGALAVVGHIDIAWSYSFGSLEAGVTGQVQGFDELLQALMHGQRLDYAIANCPICGALAL